LTITHIIFLKNVNGTDRLTNCKSGATPPSMPITNIFSFILLGYEARHIMAISGHRSEASIRSYAQNVSEDQSRSISASLTRATNSAKDVEVYQSSTISNLQTTSLSSPTTSGPSNAIDILSDLDLPSTPQLNHFVNTVLSPKMSSTDIFHKNNFQGCTFNINLRQ
jgi:hypothetical protein